MGAYSFGEICGENGCLGKVGGGLASGVRGCGARIRRAGTERFLFGMKLKQLISVARQELTPRSPQGNILGRGGCVCSRTWTETKVYATPTARM